MALHIVLVEPEIPSNTGNIARTCALTKTVLHLVKPLGFSVDDKALKRAGLDYWKDLELFEYENIEDFWARNPFSSRHFFATTKTTQPYFEAKFEVGDYIYFGREDAGLPQYILDKNKESCITIPMAKIARSLNLSNSVSIICYEALRQNYIHFETI